MTKTKILFLAASPTDMSRPALDEECRAIGLKLRASERRDALELVTRWAVRPDDLLDDLNEHQPQVVHFSGHGTDQQQIVLVNDARGAVAVSARALRELFRMFKEHIRVVVLNACFSRDQAEAIVEEIDCAVGMKEEIGDDAAIAFAASFYSAIGYGRSVQDAFEQSRVALLLKGIPEEDTPTLLVRKGVDAAKVVLVGRNGGDGPRPSPPQPSPFPPQSAPFSPSPSPVPDADSLEAILPGRWHIQIQAGWQAARMAVELTPLHQFRGEIAGPGGNSIAEGQWQADAASGQFALRGRIGNGFQVGPYAVVVQTTYFDRQQIVGVTNANEQVTWMRVA